MEKIFQTQQSQLEKESWRLMLRQKSEIEKYKEIQDKIIREVFI